jgi:ribose transport system ATP-binding protein
MFLGQEIVHGVLIDRKRQIAETEKLLKSYNYQIDPNRIVGELSVAQQKMISIIKAMNNEIKILILDEPTASLADSESEILFENIRTLREQGTSIIYISHRLDELKRIGDRVTVLRNGRYVDTLQLQDVQSIDDLTPLMIGKEIENKFPKSKGTIKEPILRVSNLTRNHHFYNVSFEVKSGEVLGFFGLIGCGFEEVLRSVFGARTYDSGTVEVFEDASFRPVASYNPKSALDMKVSYIPSDRKHEGLIMPLSVKENITIASFDKFSSRGLGWLDRRKMSSEADRFIDLLGIKVADPNFKVETLSGGNQQKVIIAKSLCRGGNIFLFSEPTVGIDVGTKVEIYQFMNELIARGAGIVLVSYELPEIMGMSDRIIVMYNGRIMKEFNRQEATEDEILKYAFGEGMNTAGI